MPGGGAGDTSPGLASQQLALSIAEPNGAPMPAGQGRRVVVPQPAGSLLYHLLTGHPEREPGELVFVADLTGELRLAH